LNITRSVNDLSLYDLGIKTEDLEDLDLL